MDDSFFRSHWNSPFYPAQRRPSAWGIPVHDVRTAASPRVVAVHPKQGIQSAEPSKVVKIPVQFVDTDRRRSESESAVRIQKVFRGFMVRKSVKKIADVRREVDEIESRISRTEVIDLMRRDSRERLGVSEMLMSLLFRLDSVRGLDPGVRNCRKTAIRKVIALQEALDAIVAADGSSAAETTGEEAIEITEAVEVPVDERKPADSCPVTQIELQNPDLVGGESGSAEVVTETDDIEVPKIQTESAPDKSPEITHENERSEAKGEGPEEIERTESQTDSSANPEIPEEKNEENQRRAVEETGGEGKKKNEKILERMMEENDRMMDMMAELFERNELQTRLLSSLSQRVKQLEKAMICDRLRRKKKRNTVVTKPEKLPEGKNS